MGNKDNIRRRKRKFHGNKYTKIQDGGPHNRTQEPEGSSKSGSDKSAADQNPSFSGESAHAEPKSASRMKILGSFEQSPDIQTKDRPSTSNTNSTPEAATLKVKSTPTGFMLLHSDSLLTIIESLLCPSCNSKALNLTHSSKEKSGFAMHLETICTECGWKQCSITSPTVSKTKTGPKPYEVNRRIVMAFRAFGKGYEALESFCMHMNMAGPMTRKNYNAFLGQLRDAYTTEASESMKNAAKSICSDTLDPTECAVSIDGT